MSKTHRPPERSPRASSPAPALGGRDAQDHVGNAAVQESMKGTGQAPQSALSALAARLGALAGKQAALTRELELQRQALSQARQGLSRAQLSVARERWMNWVVSADLQEQQELAQYEGAVKLLRERFQLNLELGKVLSTQLKMAQGKRTEIQKLRKELDALWKDQDKTAQQLDHAKLDLAAHRIGTALGKLCAARITVAQHYSAIFAEMQKGPPPLPQLEPTTGQPAAPAPPRGAATLLEEGG